MLWPLRRILSQTLLVRKAREWHKSLEESHSAQIKGKSLLGHLVRSEEAQRKILESDIFRILES